MSGATSVAADILARLEDAGLLLVQDKQALNVVTLVTGETLRGSWWSHPKGQLIFAVLSSLSDHRDVLSSKLVSGKVTLVHRRLWRAFLTMAAGGEPWQFRGLSAPARRLLASVNESQASVRASGAAVKELEVRLLVHTREVHSESGRHETAVEAWPVWARRASVIPLRSSAGARRRLEDAVTAIGAAAAGLPWADPPRGKPPTAV